jgi:hypothetical protein
MLKLCHPQTKETAQKTDIRYCIKEKCLRNQSLAHKFLKARHRFLESAETALSPLFQTQRRHHGHIKKTIFPTLHHPRKGAMAKPQKKQRVITTHISGH